MTLPPDAFATKYFPSPGLITAAELDLIYGLSLHAAAVVLSVHAIPGKGDICTARGQESCLHGGVLSHGHACDTGQDFCP